MRLAGQGWRCGPFLWSWWILLSLCLAGPGVVPASADSNDSPSPRVLLDQARSFEAGNQFPQAIAAYRAYLDQRPEDDEVRAAMARVLSWQGSYDSAVTLYRDILIRHPVDLDTRAALARVLSWQKQTEEAQRLYEGVLREDTGHVEAHQGLGDLFFWSGRAKDALTHYEAAAALVRDPDLERRIATIKRDLAREQAASTGAMSDAPSPDGRSQTLEQARTWERTGEYAQAVAGYRQALAEHPGDDETRADLARVLAREGQYEESMRLYRDVISRHPGDQELRVALARVTSWHKDFEEAERLYRAVLADAPAMRDAKQGLADILSWTHRPAEALALYEDIYRETQDPDVGHRINALTSDLRSLTRSALSEQIGQARELAWEKQYDESIRTYRAVLMQDPANVEARQGLADTLYWSGRYQEALTLYEAVYDETRDPALPLRIQAVKSEISLSVRAPVARGPGIAIPFRDYVKAGYSHYSYTNKVPDERDGLFEAAKPIGAMTLVGRIEPMNRFGLHDTPLSSELYSPLWNGAWGYVAGSAAVNAQFVPTWSMGGELFQGLGAVSSTLSLLEASFGYKRMAFKSTTINLLTPGLTIYLPWNLWLTEKLSYVPTQGSMTLSSQLTWRPGERLQFYVSGAYGTSGERITAVQDFQRVRSTIWQGGSIFPLTARLSGEISLYYEDRGFLYVRRGGSFNLIWHW